MKKIFKGKNLLKWTGLSVSLVLCACFAFAESCSTVGATQDKYTASGCSYTTQTRTCCSNKTWSGWGMICRGCLSTQCLNGSVCENKDDSRSCVGNVDHATGGTQTRTATCNSGSGWSYGLWSGNCTCESGYTWMNISCVKDLGGGFDGEVMDPEIGYRWVAHGHNCWDKSECGTAELPECNASLNGTYWSKWDSSYNLGGCGSQFDYINGKGGCQQFKCTQ